MAISIWTLLFRKSRTSLTSPSSVQICALQLCCKFLCQHIAAYSSRERISELQTLCWNFYPHKKIVTWARRGGAVVKVLALHSRDPIWVPVLSQQPRFPSSLWPRKEVEDGLKLWDPAPTWETQKRLLASDRHSIGHCAHLGSESSDGRSSSLSLLSVYPPFNK